MRCVPCDGFEGEGVGAFGEIEGDGGHGGRGAVLEEALLSGIRSGAPGAWPVRPPLEPAAGALLLAFDRAAITVGGEVGERLIASLPPDALFDTHPGSIPV